MSRILLLLGLVGIAGAFAAETDKDIERYKAYFRNLDLPYAEPAQCGNKEACIIADDFNGDGVADMAGLYVYKGERSRRANRNADLVILYSDPETMAPAHMVFVLVGYVDTRDGSTSASLGVQKTGVLRAPSGDYKLESPAINVYFGPDRGPDQFLTFRWRDGTFYGVDKSAD